MRLVPIDHPDDPRIEPYRAVRERDLVGRAGRFVAEGEVVLRLLLGPSRFRTESILIAERRLAAVRDVLAEVPDDVPVFVAAQPVMDAVAGFSIHRGVLAIGVRGEKPSAETLVAALPDPALVVGVVGVANHDNVGGIFRNAAAFGAGAVLLAGGTCDPLYRKAIRVSVGASLLVPFAEAASPEGLCDLLAGAGFDVLALSPGGTHAIGDVAPGSRLALLLGAEGAGLPMSVLARCRTVQIPMAPGFDSLNVATASGIALHRLSPCGR